MKNEKGLTYLELLLVIALISFISVFSVAFYGRFINQNTVANTVDKLASQFRKAQVYAMTGKQNSNWGVNYGSNTITLYKGDSYVNRDPAFDELFTISSNISVTGFSDINFARATGLPSSAATITVSAGNTTKTLAINSQGMVERQETVSPSAPTVTTSAATNITSSTATLNGSGNPNGASTTGWFRYATIDPGTCDDIFGTRVPLSGGTDLGSGTSPVSYFENISSLSSSTTYYFCAIASNSQGTDTGSVLSFTTEATAPAPTVSSVTGENPQTTAGGKSITINGTDFVATPTVSIGGTPATAVTFVSSTQLTATAPAKSAASYNVVVTNPDSQSGTCISCMTYIAPPNITSVVPDNNLNTAGGETVTITGSGIKVGSSGVKVDTTYVTTSGISSSATFTTPAHAAGSVTLRVYGDSGTDTNGIYTDYSPFTYVTPPSGIEYIGSISSSGNNTTAGSFSLPGGWNPGDVAVFWWYTYDNNKTITPPAELTQKQQASSADFGRIYIAYRVLQTGDSTFAWTASSVNNSTTIWGTSVFSGVNTSSDPFEAQSGAPLTFSNTANPDPPAVITVSDNAMVVPIFGKNNDYSSITPPAGYTTAGSNDSPAGRDASAGAAYFKRPTIGTEDPGPWSAAGAATDNGYVWTGALKPN